MLDPKVAAFLDALKQKGLNDQQIGTLAQQQKNPQQWQNTYNSFVGGGAAQPQPKPISGFAPKQPPQTGMRVPTDRIAPFPFPPGGPSDLVNLPGPPNTVKRDGGGGRDPLYGVNLPKPPVRVEPNLGFVQEYDQAMLDIDRDVQRADSDLRQMIQRIIQARDEGQMTLQKNQEKSVAGMRDQLAGQGILRSGIAIGKEAEIGQDYAQRISNMLRQSAEQEEGGRRRFQEFSETARREKQRLQSEKASKVSEAQQDADQHFADAQAAHQAEVARLTQPQQTPTGQYQPPQPPQAQTGPLIDPTTGRQAWTGPSGEAGSASLGQMVTYAQQQGLDPGSVRAYQMPDGRIAYYIPGHAVSPGNRAALGL